MRSLRIRCRRFHANKIFKGNFTFLWNFYIFLLPDHQFLLHFDQPKLLHETFFLVKVPKTVNMSDTELVEHILDLSNTSRKKRQIYGKKVHPKSSSGKVDQKTSP